MPNATASPIRVSFVATYPPRQCGIATFTSDLANALAQQYGEGLGTSDMLEVVALERPFGRFDYGREVRFVIREQHQKDYREAADHLNLSQTGVVNIQHEFGIFGGEDGSFILHLLENLTKPVVTTLHTVLHEPSPNQARVLKSICARSSLVVVLSQKAVEFLTNIYEIPEEKIVMVAHGVPDVPFLDPIYFKEEFNAEGRRVILSYGLLSPNKGIEVAIKALASVVKEFPDVLYMVVGATHPEVKQRHGEEYRVSLEKMVKHLRLEDHVVFHNRFVSVEKLVAFLVAADICVTPYLSKDQIVSGVLAYAVGCGNAIISTPYWYAEELLGNGNGCLVPFQDVDAFAAQLRELLCNESKRQRLRKSTYKLGRQMTWKVVAGRYLETFGRAAQEYRKLPVRPGIRRSVTEQLAIPEVNLGPLWTMTDDTGVLQHASYTIPCRHSGYCTDDNARAAMVVLVNYKLFGDEGVLPLLRTYLSFLDYAFSTNAGIVQNFLSYERTWLKRPGSQDCQGRTLWALGLAVADAPTEPIMAFATERFRQLLPACLNLTAPRFRAYSALGCLAYLRRFAGDREVQDALRSLGQGVFSGFQRNSSEDWPWCEDTVTYANGRLPQALIASGQWLGVEAMWQQGVRSLDWLLSVQTDSTDGHISLIGNNGWLKRRGERARFAQQPVEIAGLIDACYEAYKATGEERWLSAVNRCFDWFLGENDLHQMVYDFSTGSCLDGLQASGVNYNQGAESIISWLMALHRMHEIARQGATKPGEPETEAALVQ